MIAVAIMIGLLIVFLVVVSVGFYEIFGDVVYQLRDINLQLARINETVRNKEEQTLACTSRALRCRGLDIER